MSAHDDNTVPMIPAEPYQQQPMSLPPMPTVNSQIDQEFRQINQQFQDLSLQYQNPTYEYSSMQHSELSQAHSDANNVNYQSEHDYNQQNQYEKHQQTDYYGQTHLNDSNGSSNNYGDHSAASPAMYQQQSFNDPMAYGATNYAEVIFS